MNRTARLTERYIERLKFNGKPYVVRDEELKGLLVQVGKQRKSYAIQAELWRRGQGATKPEKTIRRTIRQVGESSLREVRREAARYLDMIKVDGLDPWASSESEQVPILGTVGAVLDAYTEGQSERYRADILRAKRLYMEDLIKLQAAELDRKTVLKWYRQWKDKPSAANHALRYLKSAFNFQQVLEPEILPNGNPFDVIRAGSGKGVSRANKKFQEKNDSGFFPLELIPEWWKSVEALSNPLRQWRHKLALLTGIRAELVCEIRREWIDLGRSVIRIPSPDMKTGHAFDCPLSPQTVELVLKALRRGDEERSGTPWLFPGRVAKGHMRHREKTFEPKARAKEGKPPLPVGKALRNWHRTVAAKIGIRWDLAKILQSRSLGDTVEQSYIDNRELWPDLMDAQEKISREMLRRAVENR